MSLLRKFFSAEPAERISDFMKPEKWLTDLAGGGQTTSGECVNQRRAMNLAAFFACVQVLSTDIAKLPLKIYKTLQPRGKEIFYDHPLYDILHDSPNDDMSSMSLREAMIISVLLRGDGFARIIRDQQGGGDPIGLRFIYPDRVDIKQDDSVDGIDPGPVFYNVKKYRSSEVQKINSEDMIHIHGISEDGVRGMSIIRCAAESIGVGLAAQKFGAAFFGNGSTMSGSIEGPIGLEDTARDNLRKSIDKLHTGAPNAHKIMVLEEGFKYARIGVPPEEGQFLESRQFTVEDICRWFRVPPHKIQHLLRATFSNIEEQSQEYVTDALGGWLIRVEQEFDRKLFKGEDGVFCEHLVNGLLRGNAAARGSFYTQGFSVGLFSANDIREFENMNPVPGGDDYWRPLNLGKLGEEPDLPEPDPVPGPVPPGLEQPQDQDPPEDVPAEDQVPEDPPVPPDEAAKAALLPVFLGDAARVIRKESAACERACAKYKSNDEAFNLWLESFFNEDHLGYIVDTFQPTAHALCVLTNKTWSTEFKTFRQHIKESKELATQRFHNGSETIEISNRAGKLSAALIEEICNG